MTVVVGIKTNDAVLIASDREENDTYLRNDVSKITLFTLRNGWLAGFGGAGDSAFIDFSVQRVGDALGNLTPQTSEELRSATESELLSIHTKHIFPIQNREQWPSFELIFAARKGAQRFLFKTARASVTEQIVPGFICSGSGSSFAQSLLNKYFGVYSNRGAALLAIYVVRQTKKYIRDVGGGTDLLIFSNKGMGLLTASLTAPLESMLDELDKQFEGMFFSALFIDSNWDVDLDKWGLVRSHLLAETNRLFDAFGI